MFHSSRRPRAAVALVALSFTFVAVASLAAPQPAQAAVKRCFGRNPTIVGTNGADHLIGTGGNDVIAGLGGDDVIEGRGGNDYICSNAGVDLVDGEGGRDSVNGGADDDTIFGAGSADRLAGGSGNDVLIGESGNDIYNGGSGFDFAGFLGSANPVVVDLRAQAATGEGSDGVHYIEGVIGSEYADEMYGNAYANAFEPIGGDDIMHGRGGSDAVLYTFAFDGVILDLELDQAGSVDGLDTLISIEDALGSDFDDDLSGDAAANYLDGAAGNDTINGRGGSDTCFGETITGCDGTTASAPLRTLAWRTPALRAAELRTLGSR